MLVHKRKLVVGANQIRYLLSRPAPSGRTAQWLLQLSEFDIELGTPKARKGKFVHIYLILWQL